MSSYVPQRRTYNSSEPGPRTGILADISIQLKKNKASAIQGLRHIHVSLLTMDNVRQVLESEDFIIKGSFIQWQGRPVRALCDA